MRKVKRTLTGSERTVLELERQKLLYNTSETLQFTVYIPTQPDIQYGTGPYYETLPQIIISLSQPIPDSESHPLLRLGLDKARHEIEAIPVGLEVNVLHARPLVPPRRRIALGQGTEQPMVGRDAHDPHLARWRDRSESHELVPVVCYM